MTCWAKLESSSWIYPTALLSLYGFFANCRVAEPFLTPYLIGPNKNISEEVVRMAVSYTVLCANTEFIYSPCLLLGILLWDQPLFSLDWKWHRHARFSILFSVACCYPTADQLPVPYLDILLPGVPFPHFPSDWLPEAQTPHYAAGVLPGHQLHPALLCPGSARYDLPSGPLKHS